MSSASRSLKVLLAHPGTQYSAQLARQLQRKGLLYRFWTSFALPENSRLEHVLRSWMKAPPKWLDNRVVANVPAEKLRTLPRLELAALLRLRMGAESQVVLQKRNDKFQQSIPKTELEQSDVVIGFDTSSAILADRVSKIPRKLILDQSIAHPRSKNRIYDLVRRQFPEWRDDLETRAATIGAAENAEHQQASLIVAASSFTKQTLIENRVPADKILLNPYGVDLQRFVSKGSSFVERPFRFVYAGLVCARKGIPLLLRAWAALHPKDAELWVVGPLTSTAARNQVNDKQIKFVGKIPNAQLAGVLAESDVFVFPSYFEGFGLVLLEAMAAGLPVITTTATAGPDILTKEHDGWLIEPGDLDQLLGVMRFCLENRQCVADMGRSARGTAERFSWNAYGDRWAQILQENEGSR